MTKSQIRNKILTKLKIQKEEERNRKSKIIKDRLFKSLSFKKAKKMMFYISFGGEVNTEDMIEEAKKLGKTVVVPVCRRNRIIRACVLDYKAKLTKGPYGIWEPVIKKSVNPKDLDLVIVPGIAFDRKGVRLGRGKGYYDRFLKKLPKGTVSLGLAFDFQILPSIPATANDISVNRIIFA